MQLKISIIQTELIWENVSANLDLFDNLIEGIDAEPDVIVLPEMFSTGFSMNAEKLAESMEGETVKWMAHVAGRKRSVITGSLIIREEGRYYNRLIWMNPDGKHQFYNKKHLFSMGEENNHYCPGDEKLIVHYKGWKICPLICYDLRFPVWSRNRMQCDVFDYDILIYTANWPEKRSYAWEQLLIARAIENQAYVVGVNRIGKDGNDINHSGDSGVFDFMGNKLSSLGKFENKVETVGLFLQDLYQYRKSFPALSDADAFAFS